MVPKFRIDKIERDFYGNPFIKIWNESSFFNAYKVDIFITYKRICINNGKSQIVHTKIHKPVVIVKKGFYSLNLNIDNQKAEDEMELNIYVIGHNKFGVTTAINNIRYLKMITAPQQ